MDSSLIWTQLTTLVGVILIDATLAVDNAVVMATAAAKLPRESRKKAILIGIGAAALCRILFACFALRLLSIVGLTFAGGLLLLWVAWKLWRELRAKESSETPIHAPSKGAGKNASSQAILQIIFADVSMSLDNTLAVAGTARNHFWIMVFGLSLSVLFMGVAANLLSSLIHRYRWISYVGLLIVLYVACSMIWGGAHEFIK